MINTRMCPNADKFKLISTSVSTGPCIARSQNKVVNMNAQNAHQELKTTDMSSTETMF